MPDNAGPPHWDRFRDTAMGQYLLDHEQAFLVGHLTSARPPFHLLEVGSCTGRVTAPLRHTPGFVITGLDTDLTALVTFQSLPGRHPAVLADATRPPFATASFDGIVAIQCFRYFEPDNFLTVCRQLLKPGGLLLFQAVNGASYKRRLKRMLRGSRAPHGSWVLPLEELLRLLGTHGFCVEEVRGYNWLPIRPDLSRASDSWLVGCGAAVERLLFLRRFVSHSPWVLIAARQAS